MTEYPQALGHIPALVELVPAGPDLLHDLCGLLGLLGRAKDLECAKPPGHMTELFLVFNAA